MNIDFYWWERFPGDIVPGASSDVLSDSGMDYIDCLFCDSGGIKFDDPIYLDLLDEGIHGVEQIKKREIDYFDWCLSYWGAELEKGQAKIYSLCDEDFFAMVDLDDFEKALKEWKYFVLSKQE